MSFPQLGARELLVRGSIAEGYQLIDPRTQQPVAQGLRSLSDVVAVARRHGATRVWQERIAERGYTFAVPPRTSGSAD